MTKRLEAELVVKPQDGRIADKNSYGNHPRNCPAGNHLACWPEPDGSATEAVAGQMSPIRWAMTAKATAAISSSQIKSCGPDRVIAGSARPHRGQKRARFPTSDLHATQVAMVDLQ